MAENKKSFMLYCDSIPIIEKLSDERAGKLIKHIFRYCSDLNPISDDEVVDMAFEHFKAILKRDLKKYESIVERNKTNGLKGGRPKTQENPVGYLKTQPNPTEPKKADTDTDTDILLKKETKDNVIDWDGLLNQFNIITGRKFKTVTKKTKYAFAQRLKEGYSKADILKAIKNANNHEFHKNNNNQYLTLEYISRAEKMEFYCTDIAKSKTSNKKEIGML